MDEEKQGTTTRPRDWGNTRRRFFGSLHQDRVFQLETYAAPQSDVILATKFVMRDESRWECRHSQLPEHIS